MKARHTARADSGQGQGPAGSSSRGRGQGAAALGGREDVAWHPRVGGGRWECEQGAQRQRAGVGAGSVSASAEQGVWARDPRVMRPAAGTACRVRGEGGGLRLASRLAGRDRGRGPRGAGGFYFRVPSPQAVRPWRLTCVGPRQQPASPARAVPWARGLASQPSAGRRGGERHPGWARRSEGEAGSRGEPWTKCGLHRGAWELPRHWRKGLCTGPIQVAPEAPREQEGGPPTAPPNPGGTGAGALCPGDSREGLPLCHRGQACSAALEAALPVSNCGRGPICSNRARTTWMAPTPKHRLASCPLTGSHPLLPSGEASPPWAAPRVLSSTSSESL